MNKFDYSDLTKFQTFIDFILMYWYGLSTDEVDGWWLAWEYDLLGSYSVSKFAEIQRIEIERLHP